MGKDISTTTILAIWGAFLSSVTFGWNLFRDVTKRGRLKVSCYVGNIITVGVGADPSDYLVWSVTNVGGEPVVLTHIGGALKNGHHFMIGVTRIRLPHTLKPGEYIVEYSPEINILDHNLKSLWALDSVGRTFKVPCKQVRALKKKYVKGEYGKKNKAS